MGNVLLSDNKAKGQEMYDELVDLFEIAKKQNTALYNQKAAAFEQKIKSQSSAEVIEKINGLLAKNNIDYRI